VNQGIPWPVATVFSLFFIGFGSASFFFVDPLCDWQIKMLQSQWYRRAYRIMGVIFIAVGLLFAFGFAAESIS
jgi:hypothetical protein